MLRFPLVQSFNLFQFLAVSAARQARLYMIALYPFCAILWHILCLPELWHIA
jgi:hypothetical protein